MFPVTFEKERTERFLRCLDEGQPIGVVQTVDEMLGLAGACFFGIMSHGPIVKQSLAQLQGRCGQL